MANRDNAKASVVADQLAAGMGFAPFLVVGDGFAVLALAFLLTAHLLVADVLVGIEGLFRSALFFFIIFVVEIIVLPEIVRAELGFCGIARVEDDLVTERLEVGPAEIDAGGLKRIKKEAGAFV